MTPEVPVENQQPIPEQSRTIDDTATRSPMRKARSAYRKMRNRKHRNDSPVTPDRNISV